MPSDSIEPRNLSSGEAVYLPKGKSKERYIQMQQAERDKVYESLRALSGDLKSTPRNNLSSTIWNEIADTRLNYALNKPAKDLKGMPISQAILDAMTQQKEAGGLGGRKPREVMFYCLDYLQNAPENRTDANNTGISNMDKVDLDENVQILNEGGRWKLRVLAEDGKTVRMQGFLFPPPPAVDTPPPAVDTPPPTVDTPPPAIDTPPPAVDTPPPAVDTPPPAVDTPPPAIDTPPPAIDTPPPAIEAVRTYPETYQKFGELIIEDQGLLNEIKADPKLFENWMPVDESEPLVRLQYSLGATRGADYERTHSELNDRLNLALDFRTKMLDLHTNIVALENYIQLAKAGTMDGLDTPANIGKLAEETVVMANTLFGLDSSYKVLVGCKDFLHPDVITFLQDPRLYNKVQGYKRDIGAYLATNNPNVLPTIA